MLHRFSAQTHLVVDAFDFQDPLTRVNTPLASLPRAAGVPALPLEAIGVADNPLTPADETVPADIQAFEQVVFARDGQFYIGTQTKSFAWSTCSTARVPSVPLWTSWTTAQAP